VKSVREEMTIQGDGIGLPSEVDISNATTLGLQLVWVTVTRQLGGSIQVERDRGTLYTIRFRMQHKDHQGLQEDGR